jgi:hypothetical protein
LEAHGQFSIHAGIENGVKPTGSLGEHTIINLLVPFLLAFKIYALTSTTRWSEAVATPLRSIFAIVSSIRQPALNFRDRLIASGGIALSGLMPTPPQHYSTRLGGVVRFRELGAAHCRAAGWGRFFLSAIY